MAGVIYPIVLFCVCFFNCSPCSACIHQMRNKPNQFLIQVKVYFFIIIFFFIFYFFFLLLLIKQLFSHETVKVNRLFCLFSFLGLKLWGNNPQLHYFSPAPKRFTMFFIYFHFNIILHFTLKFTLFFTTRFIMDLFQQLPVNRMSSYHLSWVFSWWSSLAVALKFAENNNLGVQRCIQSLFKYWRQKLFCERS